MNGGRRIIPTFLKTDADRRGAQVIRPETSAQMRELLRYVVTNGTGRKADVPGYDVGGKTGSAEKPGRHGYQSHVLVTSFFATFPIEDPRYVVFVLLDEPHGTKETGGIALAGYDGRAAGRTRDLTHCAVAGRSAKHRSRWRVRIHNGTTIWSEYHGG